MRACTMHFPQSSILGSFVMVIPYSFGYFYRFRHYIRILDTLSELTEVK